MIVLFKKRKQLTTDHSTEAALLRVRDDYFRFCGWIKPFRLFLQFDCNLVCNLRFFGQCSVPWGCRLFSLSRAGSWFRYCLFQCGIYPKKISSEFFRVSIFDCFQFCRIGLFLKSGTIHILQILICLRTLKLKSAVFHWLWFCRCVLLLF